MHPLSYGQRMERKKERMSDNVRIMPMTWATFKRADEELMIVWHNTARRALVLQGLSPLFEDEMLYEPIGSVMRLVRSHGYKFVEKGAVQL